MAVEKVYQIYRCNLCGNIVVVTDVGGGELSCCGQAMELLEPRQLEEGGAKHIPVIKKEGDKIVVEVGEITHPMEEEHHISFVELIIGDKAYFATFKPGDEPKAEFDVCAEPEDCEAIEYCTVHGLWNS